MSLVLFSGFARRPADGVARGQNPRCQNGPRQNGPRRVAAGLVGLGLLTALWAPALAQAQNSAAQNSGAQNGAAQNGGAPNGRVPAVPGEEPPVFKPGMKLSGMEFGRLTVELRPGDWPQGQRDQERALGYLSDGLCASGLYYLANHAEKPCLRSPRFFWQSVEADLVLRLVQRPPNHPDGEGVWLEAVIPGRSPLPAAQVRVDPQGGFGPRAVARWVNQLSAILTGNPATLGSTIGYVLKKKGFQKLVVVTTSGGWGLRQVTLLDEVTVLPRFSYDGNALAVTVLGDEGSGVVVYPRRTGTVWGDSRYITPPAGLNTGGAFYPDNLRMVITRDVGDDGNTALFEYHLFRQTLRQLTQGVALETSGSVSPDGRYLLYVSDESGTPQIWRKNVITQEVERLSFHGEYNTDPSWRPDGGAVMYAARKGPISRVVIMGPAGEDPVVLDLPMSAEQPVWSPDGRQIAFTALEKGEYKIFVASADGSAPRRLTDSPKGYEEILPAWTATPWLELPDK